MPWTQRRTTGSSDASGETDTTACGRRFARWAVFFRLMATQTDGDDSWLCCCRAGVVPGQIAAKARQYQKEKLAQEKRAMGGGAVRSSTKPPTCLLSAWPLK